MKKQLLLSFSMALLGVLLLVVPLCSAGQVSFYTYQNGNMAPGKISTSNATKPSGTTRASNQLNHAYNTEGYPKSNQGQMSYITVNGQKKMNRMWPASVQFTHSFSGLPSSATYATTFQVKNDTTINVTNSTSRYFQ